MEKQQQFNTIFAENKIIIIIKPSEKLLMFFFVCLRRKGKCCDSDGLKIKEGIREVFE